MNKNINILKINYCIIIDLKDPGRIILIDSVRKATYIRHHTYALSHKLDALAQAYSELHIIYYV